MAFLILEQQNNNHAARVDPTVPDVAFAISFYESSGGHLTLPNVYYGFDPLAESAPLVLQRKHLLETNN